MSFVLDTNIISELRKGRGVCNAYVRRWYDATPAEDLYLSVVVLGEMRRGVEMQRRRDPETARVFERWLNEVRVLFRERTLEVNREIADLWGRLAAATELSVIDGFIAATAAHHGYTVVTRNERDFQRSGVDYINPFKP
jgi:predicted nucleic acid-binding protein